MTIFSGEFTRFFFSLFQDLLTTLSTILRGSIYEKLRWAFKLYDLNGDGCITRSELEKIVFSVHELMGKKCQVSYLRYLNPFVLYRYFFHVRRYRLSRYSIDSVASFFPPRATWSIILLVLLMLNKPLSKVSCIALLHFCGELLFC